MPLHPFRLLLTAPLALLALLLAGCVAAPEVKTVTETVYVPVYREDGKAPANNGSTPAERPATTGDEREQALALLAEIGRSLSASPEEMRRDHANALVVFNRERSHYNRLRLAWFAALIGPAAGDDARQLALLEPLISKAGGLPTAHPLRPIADTLHAQLNERVRQVREEQKKAEALQQKLDALKALERQLLERERRRP